MTSSSNETNTELIRMTFKEQWWCLSALSEHPEEELINKTTKDIEAFSNECLQGTSLNDISAVFVPDLAVRTRIVKIAQSLRVNVTWVPGDRSSTGAFSAGRISVFNPAPKDPSPAPSSSSSSSSSAAPAAPAPPQHSWWTRLQETLGLRASAADDYDWDQGQRKTYRSIGNLAFRVRLDAAVAQEKEVRPEDVRPQSLQQIIFLVTGRVVRKVAGDFLFDSSYPPYIFSIATAYTPAEPYIAWTPVTTDQYKQEIGQWSEIYTGHYDDYRDTTYSARVQSDVSNRMSEMHFINRNSSFIHMDRQNYDLYFIKDAETPASTGYVYSSIIGTVLRVRTIQFFMQIVAREVDRDQENLSSEEYLEKPPTKIKDDLERTNRMKNALQTMLAPVWTDITRSHRSHYHSVLDRVISLANLKENWQTIAERIDANAKGLNAIFLDKQEESSERQESILNTVNTLLGASIIFELVSYVTMDDEVSTHINRYLSLLIILAFILNLLRLRQADRKKTSED